MGNFSISHYTGIRVEPNGIVLFYLIDMAEIPAFQEIQETGIIPEEGHPGLTEYLARKTAALKNGLLLEVNGRRFPLRRESSQVIFPPGAGGLPTMKIGARYRATLEGSNLVPLNRLSYRDTNFPERAGWKEIVAVGGHGVALLNSSAPENDRSLQLTNYPTDLLNSPPQDLEARLVFSLEGASGAVATTRSLPPSSRATEAAIIERPGAASHSSQPAQDEPLRLHANRQATPRDSFTDLVTTPQWSIWTIMVAALVAASLGGFHALEPGHGKTVVAAYLVGSRGTARHALLLGLIVTASHTAAVYLLGAVTLYASRSVVPEQLYPWLGLLSGLTIFGLGLVLFLRRFAKVSHSHHHGHGHHSHSHGEEHGHETHHHETGVSPKALVTLGLTGGIIPCPAALVVLLSALSLNRIGLGLFLIVAFSLGLAAALVAIGLLMVYARRFMSRFHGEGPLITRWLPLISSAVITLVGLAITARTLVTAGIIQIRL
jgi:ABC-type nickel/cobalt efflux system permease component RcnA